jgi:hypothetical protein
MRNIQKRKKPVYPISEAPLFPTQFSPGTYKIIPGADMVVVLTREMTGFAMEKKLRKETTNSDAENENPISITEAPAASLTTSKESAHSTLQDTAQSVSTSIFGDGTVASGNSITKSTTSASTSSMANENANAKDKKQFESRRVKSTLPNTVARTSIPKGIAYYHVYSGALMEASPVFRKMLTGENWAEGIRKEDGKFYITVEDANIRDLEILFNIMHANNHSIPATIDLEQLARIVVLVDYYQCVGMVAAFVPGWVNAKSRYHTVPTSIIDRDLMLWICVSYVFRLETEFSISTEVAILNSKVTSLPTYNLPIVKVTSKW